MDVFERFADIVSKIRQEYLVTEQNYPWIIGFSGGKDSTLVTHAVFEALLSIAPSKRTRDIHIVSNDTLVESPLVIAHLQTTLAIIEQASRNLRLPITTVITQPDLKQSFWVNIIGRGYPTPNQSMRWCTDRLKIYPNSRYILGFVFACWADIVKQRCRWIETID
jgi:DNA sulfur modification protein DndC